MDNRQLEKKKRKLAPASFSALVRLFTLRDTLLKPTSDHVKYHRGLCALKEFERKASQQTGNLPQTSALIAVILQPNRIAEQEKR